MKVKIVNRAETQFGSVAVGEFFRITDSEGNIVVFRKMPSITVATATKNAMRMEEGTFYNVASDQPVVKVDVELVVVV